ncbi:GntR family transcriptional regulator [Streptomyces cyslabdanicus]|uniref:GntR family transcriptional regulator n=1 Tax=Streptomyces cyslabdanicus TaxID=1470456 RepID=UPI004044621F
MSSSKLYRNKLPLRDIVGESIRSSIYDGTFAPGTRLVEQELAQRYSVSRLPVREALRVLHNEGLVEHLPTRGMVVRTLDERQVAELYDLREVLEVLAAQQASERVAQGAECGLAAALHKASEAAGADDAPGVHAANSDLHQEITALADNVLLAQTLEPIVGRVDWLRRGVEDFDVIFAEHVTLTDAIAVGDVEGAGEAARAHVRASRERTLSGLFG